MSIFEELGITEEQFEQHLEEYITNNPLDRALYDAGLIDKVGNAILPEDGLTKEYVSKKIKQVDSYMTIHARYKQLMQKYDVIQSVACDIQQEIINLQYECQHPNMMSHWGSGTCADCGYETSGWYCPKSPNNDRECEYYDPDTDTYNEDCCIYCGEPEERK